MALSSQLIKDSSREEINEALRKVMMKLGIRAQNIPNDLETLVLYEHIIDNYGGHRLNEIPLAFDMAIKQCFCDKDGVLIDANCYENFSCLYISKIMNAYRAWSESEHRTLQTKSPEIQKIFTEEELKHGARESVEIQYQMFLKGYEIKNEVFNKPILISDGLIKDGESVIDFYKRVATEGRTNIYIRE